MLIEEFEWDEDNLTKVTGHGLTAGEIDSILEDRYGILRNKRHRAGTHRIVGRSSGGKLITVIVVASMHPGWWRPVNAWPSDNEERTFAQRNGI